MEKTGSEIARDITRELVAFREAARELLSNAMYMELTERARELAQKDRP